MNEIISVLLHDAATAYRGLVRRPFFAVATVVMLALAIGANAMAFGLVYDVYVAPLPYHDPGRLVVLRHMRPRTGLTQPLISPDDYVRLAQSLKGIQDIGLYVQGGEATAMIGGVARGVSYAQVTPSWFRTLGLVPALGALPGLDSGQKGGPPEAMISYKFWQAAFGGAASVIGRTIDVGAGAKRIVGVLPRDYAFAFHKDVLEVVALPMARPIMQNVNEFGVARLAPGVTLAALDRQIDEAKRFVLEYQHQNTAAFAGMDILDARLLRPVLIGGDSLAVLPLVLQGMALLLLALAIANAANLALVRQRGRIKEYRLRRVIGASRAAVMRLLLLEQVPIGIAVAVLALAIGFVAERGGIAPLGAAIGVTPFHFSFGWPEVLAALALTLISVLVITAIPLVQLSRRTSGQTIGRGGTATMDRGTRGAQRLMGVVQVMLALALLIASFALGGSLYAALSRPLGFQPAHRLIASVLLPQTAANTGSLAAIEAGVARQPGITAVGGFGFAAYPFSQEHYYSLMSSDDPHARRFHANMVTPDQGYFRTMGIALRAGQRITTTEYRSGARVMIVGAGLAQRVFGTERVIGKTVDLYGLGKYRIVGVTNPVVWRVAPWHQIPGTIYFPVASVIFPGATLQEVHLVVRYRGSVLAAEQRVTSAVAATVPGAVVSRVLPYRRLIFIDTAFRTLAAWLAVSFALIALVVAGLGVYAVNAFVARARLPEFGMRAMLGASPARLLRLALRDAAWLLAFGLGGGALGGYLLIRAMSPLLFEIGRIEPLVFITAVIVVSAIVLGAAWKPASLAANTPVKSMLDAS
ncbi:MULTISPECIES: ABC transporter permease [Acidiphilium]|uniref:Duplicated orphan permease n=1 Tax=Acidiphilium rubrum TaxID=526 RepID=A0A8G2CK12_ACIRU|nr:MULTISPECIES: ABC transporter permease [Acidiphilium]SIQ64633.1 duplicated orphan permease [Acidiphilium rubrum]